MDAVANETPLPDKWVFMDEKGHKRLTYTWLSGNSSPKKSVAPTTSFSPLIGQKCPLETDYLEDISYRDKLDAIKYHMPLPKSTVEANLNAWTETINKFLDITQPLHPEISPMTLCTTVLHAAEKLMKWDEVNLTQSASSQDTVMQDLNTNLSKTELIRKTTTIWWNMAKTLWQDNILTCNQEMLDQATHLLLLDDTTHKFAMMSEAQVYDMELNWYDSIIGKITELNENASKAIKDIQSKSNVATNKEKIDLIKQQGWETAK
ncbi:hypothetical protein AMATHDRAFT_9668 [Amanita thiersii Skay4041]|uniref:Uncharacterized protein n=1 Tax=Amanita thiersii Skay4041 TaxID=703135 RepID=A0A2A9NC16_9AGAR|nr:hypothetical protein AMATHDRAFT_9668 [Amanita thiersii Skay4041]